MLDKEWLKSVLEQCAEYGYRTSPVNADGKTKPRKNGEDYKDLKDYVSAEKIAVMLDDVILLDYDGNKEDAKGKIMSVEELEEKLDLDLVGMPPPFQINDDGDSIHWLFKIPDGVDRNTLASKVAKRKKATAGGEGNRFPFMDIQWGDRLVVNINPSKTLNLLPPDAWEECPDIIIDELKKNKGRAAIDGTDDEEDGLAQIVAEAEEVAEDEIREQLSYINPCDLEYDGWLEIMTATKVACAGQEYGRIVFKEWSSQSPKHDEHTTDYKWASFSISGGITQNTFFYLTNQGKRVAVAARSREAIDNMVERIKIADIETLESLVLPDIRKGAWDVVRKEQLAKCVQSRFKELTGATVKLPDVREMVAPVVAFGEFTDDMPKPEWCEPWVYVGTHGEFFHLDVDRHLSNDTFNMEFTKLVPVTGDNGQKASASRFVMNHGFIEVADRLEYLPTDTDRLVDLKGVTVFNSFDVRSLPKFDTKMTPEGLEAVKVIQDHIKMLCNDSVKDSKILEQWFAHQIQRKGIKILWCPLICSIEGTGKGLMEELLRRLLGSSNIRVVQPEQVKSNFKASWAVGSCVNILNELKVAGSNRHEVANSLKPMISDPSIRVEDKNVKSFEARNTANYLAYTNYLDAIPLTETSRRWWPVRMNLDNLNDIGSALGLSKDAYFDRLTGAIRNHWGQVGLWLSEYEISDEFTALKQAPETQFKLDMVATEGSKITGLEELEEVFREGGELIKPKVASLNAVYDALIDKLHGQEIITKRDLTYLMGRLGFTKRDKQVYVSGKQIVVWTKGSFEAEEIREFLK